MNLLFTGGTGFLGANIKPSLEKLYDVKTLGRANQNDIEADLSLGVPELSESFDIVLHAAGKAHVIPKTEQEVNDFYTVNTQGTINLCKALGKNGVPKAFIFISTVAVYGEETGIEITEDHPLEGMSAYAKSKIQAEEYLKDWCQTNNVKLSILRCSLLAGKNAPGNLGSMVKGIKARYYFNIDKGRAKKSVLMVDDITTLIPKLVTRGGIYNLCDNYHPSFGEIAASISKQLNIKEPISIPLWIAKSMAFIGDLFGPKFPINSTRLKKITSPLTFSCKKAMRELDWEPLNVLENFKI